MREAWGFSVSQIWPLFGSFYALKNSGFRLWCLVRSLGFFQFSLLVNKNGGCVLRFFWICQGSYTPVALKLVLLYSLLPLLSCRGMHDKPSIFSSPYLVVTAAEQTYYEKLKITLLSCDDNKITELRVETTTKLLMSTSGLVVQRLMCRLLAVCFSFDI